ncbi:MAG TPA: GGDEF domain-containing protein [Candidatus Mediterraneibacter merdavium]|nr:GGDEF domain-containing protein [Candidatus Mediterraneibacter merdavium]
MRKRNKKQIRIRWDSSMLVTSVMVIVIVTLSVVATNHINQLEEMKSIERLYKEADNVADMIEMYAQSDRETLEVLAAVIEEYDDLYSEELWSLLDSYSSVGLMSGIELLLPDNTVLRQDGRIVDAEGVLSFEEEAAMGPHISDRETDIEDPEKYIVRHCVPIIRNGRTAAILSGIIDLGKMPEGVELDPYGGKAALYIIDGNTGDFLIDTWHPGEVGNIWGLGEREMAPGYDSAQLKQGVSEGDSSYVIFVSKTIGEYLYFYYEPMQINEWRIAVSVPENVVFENANAIKRLLNTFLMLEILCFIAYFLWMLHYVRRTIGEKQRQIETLNYIYDVEKLLFNAHVKQENIWAALEKTGAFIGAERVAFWTVGTSQGKLSFLWENSTGVRRSCDEKYFLRLLQYFEQGHSEFAAYDVQSVRAVFPEQTFEGIYNMIAVPVGDVEGNVCGILAGCNMLNGHVPVVLLKNMEFSFGMFFRNLKSLNDIREQGDRDVLTGLYNRNRYERDAAKMSEAHTGPLVCIYIDINGLHEMNNTKGHYAGDSMLQTVAQEIEKRFSGDNIYRIGGDEFIVFVPEADKADVESKTKELEEVLQEKDYYISVGVQYEKDVTSIDGMVEAAEKKMYAEKKRYYARRTNDRRAAPRG